MEITITSGTIDLIGINGTIDALTSPEMITAIHKHIHDGHPNIVLDFSKVEFMSSAGLRAILASVKESRSAGGDLRIAAPQTAIDKVLKMAGFHNIVKVFATTKEALDSFEA